MIKRIQTSILSSYYWLAVLLPIAIAMGRGVADTVLTTVALLFILDTFAKRKTFLFKEKWFLVAIALWGYMLIRSVFAEFPILGLKKSLPFIRFPLFGLCCQYLGSTNKDFGKKIYISSLIAIIFLTIDGYIQYIFGKDLLGNPISDEGNFYRLTGPFSKLVLGSTITILSIPALSKMLENISNKSQILVSGLLVISIYTIVFLSGERSALVQLTLAIFLLILILIRDIKIILILVVFAILLGTASLYIFDLNKVISRQIFSILEILNNYANTPYGKLWNAGIHMGKENWLFGIGPMQFEGHCNKISDFCSYHPHNIYIEIFSETGVIGLTLLLNMFYFIAKKFVHSSKTTFSIGAFVAFTMKILPIPSSGFFKNWYAVPLWFIIGWVLSSSAIKEKK
jgi:O-antigen ligase